MKPIYDETKNYRVKKKFTFLPKRLSSDEISFLKYYMIIEQKIYPHQNLYPSITVPDKPFWIELYSQPIPYSTVILEEVIMGFELNEFIKGIK